jgi:sialate O-acetylesterase
MNPRTILCALGAVALLMRAPSAWGGEPTDWLHEARWGVMTHYLGAPPSSKGGTELTAQTWNQQVDAFDVEGLANQLASTGAKYLLFTIGQNSGHYCSPNAIYDRIVGIAPSKCSRRDLIADLAKALAARRIRLMVYLPSGAPAADPVARKALGWRWGQPGGWQLPGEPVGGRLVEFQRNWEAVAREWSLRWGKSVSGWWIDGCYFADQMYRFDDEPNFASFARSMKAGNPDALVAFNPGVRVPVIVHTKYDDYTAGEVNLPQLAKAIEACPGRWLECEGRKTQFQILTYLGTSWCRGDRPQSSDEEIVNLTRKIADKGGAITYDVPIQTSGLIADAFVAQLRAVGEAMAGKTVSTTVTLPHLFSDNMVIQRDMPVPVWGRAEKGEEVTVTLGPESRSVKAGDDGRWKVLLPSFKAGGPLELIVTGNSGNSRIVKNVLVGEVWVCSGQSNMEKPIGIHPGQKPCPNYEQEIAGANYPEIRLLEVPPKGSAQPVEDPKVEWLVCSPQTILVKRGGGHGFSACAYFFGRELYRELKVPIGLISANVSGTRCEPWTPSIDDGKTKPNLYNGLIHPLVPYAIRGVIWYQGESNMSDGLSYYPKMRTLIEDWRKAWGQGDFPFYFVPLIREAQRATLAVPNTGMAVTIDIGSYPDCHCPNKQDVGKRLALWALAKDYGRKDLVYCGPLYRGMAIEGDKIRVQFDHVGGGLTTRDGAKELTCFEIAGADKRFVAATARIDGSSVVVSSPEVPHPVAVRLAWDDKSVPNLMNQKGLPATTFSSETP